MEEFYSDPETFYQDEVKSFEFFEHEGLEAKKSFDSPISKANEENEPTKKQLHIYEEQAMINLGFTKKDLEYPSDKRINRFSQNPKLRKIAKDELYGEIDRRRSQLEEEQRRLFENEHKTHKNSSHVHFTRNIMQSPRSQFEKFDNINRSKSSDIAHHMATFNQNNANTSDNQNDKKLDFYNVTISDISPRDDMVRWVKTQHKRKIEDYIFKTLSSQYQKERMNDALERRNETVFQSTINIKNYNKKKETQYNEFCEHRFDRLNQKIAATQEKINQDNEKTINCYVNQLERAKALQGRYDDRIARAQVNREMIQQRKEERNKQKYQRRSERVENSLYIKKSILLENQINLHEKESRRFERQRNSYSAIQHEKLIKQKEFDVKRIEREANMYRKLVEKEDQIMERNKNKISGLSDHKKEVLQNAQERKNKRINDLREKYEERDKRVRDRIQNEIAEDYRQYLINKHKAEEEKKQRIELMKEERENKIKEQNDLYFAREWLKEVNFNEKKKKAHEAFQEKMFQENIRHSLGAERSEIRKRKNYNKIVQKVNGKVDNSGEKRRVKAIKNEIIRLQTLDNQKQAQILDDDFNRRFNIAMSNDKELGKLAAEYDVDIEKINEAAQKQRKVRPPLPVSEQEIEDESV